MGLPLTLGPSPPSLWLEVISKIKAKIVSWGGYWLTMAGKLGLIKATLSTLPLFQSSLLFSPKSITTQISKLLRDFLWNGGKGNQNKLHLVGWETIKKPMSEGGLQIWDLGLANVALGGKIIWQMIVEKKHPVSKILQRKYIKGCSIRNLQSANTLPGTAIWNLCRKRIDHIHHQIYRIPGNGMKILLWEESILGNPPLSTLIQLREIKSWLINKGLLRLADICIWDDNGTWVW